MRITVKYLFLLSIVYNLLSCKSSSYFKTKETSTPVNSSYQNNSQADALIQPYKTKLDDEMNEVLVISAEEFPKERGKPETKLGNLVADLSLETAKKMYGDSINFCLLNFGGLRTSLPKGDITRGKIFELMPFENELVVVTISKEMYYSFLDYIYNSGGQPISGAKIVFNKSGEKEISHIKSYGDAIGEYTYYNILTTDYLANGGDNMNFFLNPIKIEPVGIKLRDAIIQYCINENNKGNQLTGKLDGRITFE